MLIAVIYFYYEFNLLVLGRILCVYVICRSSSVRQLFFDYIVNFTGIGSMTVHV